MEYGIFHSSPCSVHEQPWKLLWPIFYGNVDFGTEQRVQVYGMLA